MALLTHSEQHGIRCMIGFERVATNMFWDKKAISPEDERIIDDLSNAAVTHYATENKANAEVIRPMVDKTKADFLKLFTKDNVGWRDKYKGFRGGEMPNWAKPALAG